MIFPPDWNPAEKRNLPQSLIKSPRMTLISFQGHTPSPRTDSGRPVTGNVVLNTIRDYPRTWRRGQPSLSLDGLRVGEGEILGAALLVKGTRVLDGNSPQISSTGLGGAEDKKSKCLK